MLIVTEDLVILTSIIAATFVSLGKEAYVALYYENGLLKAFLVTLVCQLCLYYNDLYDLRVVKQRRELFIRLLQSFGSASILLALAYYLDSDIVIGRGVFILSLFLLLFVLSSWRLLFNQVNRVKKFKENVLILGSGNAAVSCAKALLEREELGLNLVGFVDNDPRLIGKSLVNPKVIGLTDDLVDLVHRHQIKHIVVALQDRRGKIPFDTLLDLKSSGIKVEDAASVYEKVTGKIHVDTIYPSSLIFSDGFRSSRWVRIIKRLFDIVLSALGVVLTLPLFILIPILIKLDSKGPVLFKQQRPGKDKKLFTMLKFRSMVANAVPDVLASQQDSRITKVGGFLRKYRLDELPQLLNVLAGDMSLVGPRPEVLAVARRLEKEFPYYNQRYRVRPGITGWAQVKFGYCTSTEESKEKLKYDLYYVKNLSLLLDLVVLFETVKMVLFGQGAR